MAKRKRTEFDDVSIANVQRLLEMRRQFLVPVDQSMVMIGQSQRAGGTLLNSLFDANPEVFTHPFQLRFTTEKYNWPAGLRGTTDEEAAEAFERLHQAYIQKKFEAGYTKQGKKTSEQQRLPFAIVPTYMDWLFMEICREQRPETTRGVLDAYFTALFNAWLDLDGLRKTPKKWIVAFAPRFGWAPARDGFFGDYPDGRLLLIIREPRAWCASEALLSRRGTDAPVYADHWLENADQLLEAKKQRPDSVRLLTYESIVLKSKSTMRALARWLDITYDPMLTLPSFNGLATEANSSHDVTGHGIKKASLNKWKSTLSEEDAELIHDRTESKYEELLESADIS